jgi:serine/threonine protein kinase
MIGQNVGQYRVIEQIGLGGMATVYKAYQPSMDRYVAIKVLPHHFMHDPTFLGRFEREAHTIAKLEHIHILPVYDYGRHEDIPYLVMRYVEGGSLSDLLRAHPTGLPLAEAVRLIGQIASALDYAHARGVIHRDVKPSNALLDYEGNVLLTDFGIAKIAEATVQLTTGGTVGTPAYMSPEQGMGKELTPATDVYSLGVVLYQILTGRVPFEAETPIAVIHAHIYDPLPLPRNFRPDLPEAVERVLLKALAKVPGDRYQTAGEMAAALNEAVRAAPAPPPEKTLVAPVEEVEPIVVEEPPPAPVAIEPTVPAEEWPSPPAPVEGIGPTVVEEPTPPAAPTPPAVLPSVPAPSAAPARARRPAGLLIAGLGIVAAVCIVGVVVTLILPRIRPPAPTTGSDKAQRLTINSAADQAPTYAPLSGNLAFASNRDGDFEIYSLGADGNVTQLTFNDTDDLYPAYAPTGGNLAFASNRDGDFEIYSLDAGGNVTQLTFNDTDDLWPAYAPTGGNLAFASERDGDFEIYVLDADGNVTQLTFNDTDDLYPAYAPRGGNLAFASERDGDFEIYVLDADGNVTQLTSNNADDIRPDYAPLSGNLAFASDRDGDFEIYVLDADGDVTQLTFNNADDLYPAYSPDGSSLAFASKRDGNFEIYALGPGG